jgi:hypothetical protein
MCGELSTAQAGASGGVMNVAHYIIPHGQTQSSRVCSYLIILLRLMLPRDHFIFFMLCFTTVGVKCCVTAVKKLPRSSLQCCYIFRVLRDHWCQHYLVIRIEYRSSRCWRCKGIALYIMHHVQTQSNLVCSFLVILLWLMLLRDHFDSRFL